MDLKWDAPRNPARLFRDADMLAEAQSIAMVSKRHAASLRSSTGRDMFGEFHEVNVHLFNRRFGPEKSDLNHVKSLSDSDFLDIFHQYIYFHDRGYPMHSTGLFDGGLFMLNHRHPCTAVLVCSWHNQIALRSMRMQLSGMYVIQTLGLTKMVQMFPNSTGVNAILFPSDEVILEPHDWPLFGKLEHGD